MAEIQKGFLKGWDWNINEKNPLSIAMGLLTTVFLMGIMTRFLGTILLQLIKLTLRGLFWACNDYFFLHGKVGKVIWKGFGDPFFSFSDVEGFEWKLELEPQAWVWEQSMRGEVTSIEGIIARKHGQNLSNNITPRINLFPFHISFLYSYRFLLLILNSLLFLSSKLLFQKK